MIRLVWLFSISLCVVSATASAEDWPQGPGSHYDFQSPSSNSPSSWSVVFDEQIAWRVELPETGQSTPVVVGDRLFLTTMKPVDADTPTGRDVVAWCFDKSNGSVLWKRDIPGSYATKMSAPFGDASSPAAVSDGDNVWFLNPTGRLICFDMDGQTIWEREVTSVSRTRPVLYEGKLILHRQVYLPNNDGTFSHEHAHAGKEQWTQLQAIDAKTGSQVWITECGANMGCVPLIQHLSDGTAVLVVGRGGGHGPPEKPEGVSLVNADSGETIWTVALPKFMSTQTYPIFDDQALIFHKGDHLWIDAESGKVTRKVSIVDDVPVRTWTPDGYVSTTESLQQSKPRSITQQSNLLVGKHHYFRSYTRNYLGRVDVITGNVEYLELPIQVQREADEPGSDEPRLNGRGRNEQRLYNATKDLELANPPKRIKGKMLRPNLVRNSRGFLVMGDGRAQGTGWGHICAPIPTAFGDRLFIPLMSGNVFVIKAGATRLDEEAVLAINDLGPLGDSFTRSSISTDGNRAYARTIRELIAIGD